MKPKISVVINTLNEEKNLPFALASVCSWADEIVVVDMYSDDRTVEIAREFGAKVSFHERTEFFDAAREFALSLVSNDWVFLLDADEIVPEPLSRKLSEIVSEGLADVYKIPRLNYLLGEPVLHTGWGPYFDRQVRLFKRHGVVLNPRLHGFIHPASDARVVSLEYHQDSAIHHFNYVDVEHFVSKLNRYTSIEAQQAVERKEASGYGRMTVSACREFALRFLIRKGYKDGWRGFYLSALMAFYRIVTFAKMEEYYRGGGGKVAEARYRKIAAELVEKYPRVSK